MDVLPKEGEEAGSDVATYFAITSTVSVGCAPSMPNVFALGGWAMGGIVGLFGLATWFTGVLLLECMYAVPGKRLNSYAAAGEAAFGVWGRVVVQGFSNFSLLSFAALFIKSSAMNFSQVSLWLGVDVTETAWAWISGGVVLIPYVAFRELKEIGIFSVLGLITVLVTVVMGMCLSLLSPATEQLHRAFNWEGFPAALGTLCFMLGGNVIFTHVESGMKNPGRWPLVLGLAMATVVVLYLLLGVVGYWMYGEGAINPVMQNFQQGYLTSALVIVISLHLLVDTVFQLISFSVELEAQVSMPSRWRRASRCAILVLSTAAADFIPHFGAFMSLAGALGSPVMIFIAPVLLNMKLVGWKNRHPVTYMSSLACILLGVVGCVLGLKGAIQEMHV